METGNAIILIGLCGIALGISVCAFAFKYMAISAAAGVLWLIIGLNRIIASETDFDAPVGIFCLLLSIVMFLSIAFLRQKPPETQEPDYYTYMSDRIEKLRGSTEKFKPRGKDIPL